MGQAVAHEVEELATCGGRGRLLQLREKGSHQEQGSHRERWVLMREVMTSEEGCLSRSDLSTRLSMPDFIVVKANEVKQSALVEINENGTLYRLAPGERGKRPASVKELAMPDAAVTYGGQLMCSIDNKLQENSLQIYRCRDVQDIIDILHEQVSVGAESFNIAIGLEMVRMDFDKARLVEEQETRIVENTRRMLPNQIVTSLTFGPMRRLRLTMAPDVLTSYLARLKEDPKTSKESMISLMRGRGVDYWDIERFKEATGSSNDARGKTARYFQILAAQAPTVQFLVLDEHEEYKGTFTIKDAIMQMTTSLQRGASKLETWKVFASWEPLNFTTSAEFMNQARWHCAMGDEENWQRLALRVMAALVSEASHQLENHATKAAAKRSSAFDQLVRQKRSERMHTMQAQDTEMLITASRSKLDTLVGDYERGNLRRENFEEQFEEVCQATLNTVDAYLMPQAHAKEPYVDDLVACLALKADYLRYLYVWIPSRRSSIDTQAILGLYQQAIELAAALRPRHYLTTIAQVNHALARCELFRDADEAAADCRRAVAREGVRHLHELPTATEIFSWKLLEGNLAAFETKLVILDLTFAPESLYAHGDAVMFDKPEGATEMLARPAHAHAKPGGSTEPAPAGPILRSASRRDMESELCAMPGLGRYLGLRLDSAMRESTLCQILDQCPREHGRTEASLEEQAIRRWLRSQPMRPRGVGKDPQPPWIAEIQWVDYMEPVAAEDSTPGGDARCADGLQRFRVACTVRFKVPELKFPTSKTKEGAPIRSPQVAHELLHDLHQHLGHPTHARMLQVLLEVPSPNTEWLAESVDQFQCDRCQKVYARESSHRRRRHGSHHKHHSHHSHHVRHHHSHHSHHSHHVHHHQSHQSHHSQHSQQHTARSNTAPDESKHQLQSSGSPLPAMEREPSRTVHRSRSVGRTSTLPHASFGVWIESFSEKLLAWPRPPPPAAQALAALTEGPPQTQAEAEAPPGGVSEPAQSTEISKESQPAPQPQQPVEPETVTILQSSDLCRIATVLDNDGVLLEDVSGNVTGGSRLRQGDVLLFRDALKRASVKDLSSMSVYETDGGVKLAVLPCLRVSGAHVVDIVSYPDVHHLFEGFGSGGPLRPTAAFQSLEGLRRKASSSSGTGSSGNTVKPRRVRGLSGRRNPRDASARGCR